MLSIQYLTALAIVRQIAAASAVEEGLPDMADVLLTVDRLILIGAAAFLVGMTIRLLSGRQRDLLAAAPTRPNDLAEDALIKAVMVYLFSALVISGLVELTTGGTQSAFARVLVGSGAQGAGIGACLIIGACRFEGGLRRFWFAEGAARLGTSLAVTVALTIVALGLCPIVRDATVSAILYVAPGHQLAPHPTIQALQDVAQPVGILVALWTGAVVLAPVAEELFFRGLLQTFLQRLLPGRWSAIGLTSLAFGVVHFQQPQAIPALVALAVLLGYAYEQTGSLVPPILVHALFNLKTLVWDALGDLPALTMVRG